MWLSGSRARALNVRLLLLDCRPVSCCIIDRRTLIPLPYQSELAWYWNDSGRFVAVAASIQAAMEAVSDGRDLTGKRGLNRARSRSSGAAGGAMAVSWKAGRRVERASAASMPVRAG